MVDSGDRAEKRSLILIKREMKDSIVYFFYKLVRIKIKLKTLILKIRWGG